MQFRQDLGELDESLTDTYEAPRVLDVADLRLVTLGGTGMEVENNQSGNPNAEPNRRP